MSLCQSSNLWHCSPSNGDPKQLSLGFSQKKFFGTKDLDDKYQGSSSGNPSDGAFYQIYATSVDDLTSTGTVRLLVVVDYIAVLSEPKTPAQS